MKPGQLIEYNLRNIFLQGKYSNTPSTSSQKLRHKSDNSYKRAHVRSSNRSCSVKEGVLKNFANSTGKHLCWSLLMKLQAYLCKGLFIIKLQTFREGGPYHIETVPKIRVAFLYFCVLYLFIFQFSCYLDLNLYSDCSFISHLLSTKMV